MIDFEHSDLFLQSSIEKQMKITSDSIEITNSDLYFENFSLNESICSESSLKFGSCEASSISFRVKNIYSTLKDKWLTVKTVLDGNSDIVFQYGKYKVYSDTPTADRQYRDIVAYDMMYDILNTDVKAWYQSLSFPITLKQFRDSFANYFGIQQVEKTLCNDNITISKTLTFADTDTLSGKTVICAIAEINGAFGHITRDNKLDYITLKMNDMALLPRDDLFPDDDLFPQDWAENTAGIGTNYSSCTYEDYLSEKITKLSIYSSEDSVATSVGTDGNEYKIVGNFLVSDKSSDDLRTIASNIYGIVKYIGYRPYNCAAIHGNPCYEVGDGVRITTKNCLILSYILNRTMTGIQALKDTYSANGTKEVDNSVNSIQSSFQSIGNKFHKVNNTLEEFSSEIYDPVTGTSRITQNADSISSEVKDRQNGDNANYSLIKQNADAISSEIVARGESEEALSSRIGQTASSIELNVSNGDDSSSISLTITKEDGSTITTKAKTIRFEGDVVFASDLTDGTTVISGDNIKTGKVSADCIKTDELIVGKNVTMGANAKISWDNVTDRDDIADKDYVDGEIDDATDGMLTSSNYRTTITNNAIKTWGLEVGNEIKMGSGATISWGNVSNKPSDLAYESDIPSESTIKSWSTTITENTIKTGTLTAQNLTVQKGNFTGAFSVNYNDFEINVTSSQVKIGRNADDSTYYEYITMSNSGMDIMSYSDLDIYSRTSVTITSSNGTTYIKGDCECDSLTFQDLMGNTNPPISTSSTRATQLSSITCTSGGGGIALYGSWGGSSIDSKARTLTVPSSDIRLKENVEDCEIDNALDVINQIKVRSFDWKNENLGHQKIGFIADELEEIDDRLAVGGGDESYKSVDTFYMMGYVIKTIQELSAENRALKQELSDLKQLLKEKGVI